MSAKTKQCNNRVQTSNKFTPIQASLKLNNGFAYKILLNKRKESKPKHKKSNLVRKADERKSFSKGDPTKWSYKSYNITEIINDTVPSYHIDNLQERYNEALLKKTNLARKEEDSIVKKMNLN